MAKTIWKFEIPAEVDTDHHMPMPKGAAILHVESQHHHGCFWALVDPDAQKEDAVFRVYGTGYAIPDDASYIGTFMHANGLLVWHLFKMG